MKRRKRKIDDEEQQLVNVLSSSTATMALGPFFCSYPHSSARQQPNSLKDEADDGDDDNEGEEEEEREEREEEEKEEANDSPMTAISSSSCLSISPFSFQHRAHPPQQEAALHSLLTFEEWTRKKGRSEQDAKVEVLLKLVDGQTMRLLVEAKDDLTDLMRQLTERRGMSSANALVMYRGKVLCDHTILSQLDSRPLVLHIQPRLRV